MRLLLFKMLPRFVILFNSFSVLICNYFRLIRQAIRYAETSPSHSCIRPLPLPGQLFCSVDQIALHLLPVQIRVISPHNPPFHQKCCRSADKGCCKGGSRARLITTARTWCTDIDARSGPFLNH